MKRSFGDKVRAMPDCVGWIVVIFAGALLIFFLVQMERHSERVNSDGKQLCEAHNMKYTGEVITLEYEREFICYDNQGIAHHYFKSHGCWD